MNGIQEVVGSIPIVSTIKGLAWLTRKPFDFPASWEREPKMCHESENGNTGEEMSVYIFKRYEEYRDRCEALEKENAHLRFKAERVEMISDSTDYYGGEAPVSDYYLKTIMAAIAEALDASKDIDEARSRFDRISSADKLLMTDYQFKQYEAMRDKVNTLTYEVESLREENARLKNNKD